MSLVDLVIDDIHKFIKQQSELLFNEFDFQMQLALFLRQSKHVYDAVDAEYYLPKAVVDGYDWDSNIYLDLVVSRDGEYVPVELKYCTKAVTVNINRFGETIKDVEIIHTQSAQDIRRYDFWKDVRRVELVTKRFDAVKSGVAVFLTNDPSYVTGPREDAACAPFSMRAGHTIGGGIVDWLGDPATRKNHQPFRLDGRYSTMWHNVTISNEKFYYTIINI